jgi:hypothetical protein
MMTPYFSHGKDVAAIPIEIVQIREEIVQIDLHRSAHVAGDGQVKQLDQSCRYCQTYGRSSTRNLPSLNGPATLEFELEGNIRAPRFASSKAGLERTVDLSGKKGLIVVPRTWAGKRVRVSLL